MRLCLSNNDLEMLDRENISIAPDSDYTEDEALAILDMVYEIEVKYAQDSYGNSVSRKLASQYADIADKIFKMIPED